MILLRLRPIIVEHFTSLAPYPNFAFAKNILTYVTAVQYLRIPGTFNHVFLHFHLLFICNRGFVFSTSNLTHASAMLVPGIKAFRPALVARSFRRMVTTGLYADRQDA